jgi:carbamoyltransferase
MSYNILGIIPGHNSSAALISGGELIYYLEEERLSRLKRDLNPFRTVINLIQNYHIDELSIAGVNKQTPNLVGSNEEMFTCLIRKFYPKLNISEWHNSHHLTHISLAFNNSEFKECIGIVVDGNGSSTLKNEGELFETETIYHCTSPFNFREIKKIKYNLTQDLITIGKAYEAVTEYLGFKSGEEGKTMGLSSYGKDNLNIPPFIINQRSNPIYFSNPITHYYGSVFNEKELNSVPKEDIAYRIQNDSQKLIGDYIEQAIKTTGLNYVCCSGGYFLNCVNNYYLQKRFPNVNFYFEPISHDGGTSIGAALLSYYQNTSKRPTPIKTLYNGPQYTQDQLIDGIKKYVN